MKILSLFSGIGEFERAIENKNVEYNVINVILNLKYLRGNLLS